MDHQIFDHHHQQQSSNHNEESSNTAAAAAAAATETNAATNINNSKYDNNVIMVPVDWIPPLPPSMTKNPLSQLDEALKQFTNDIQNHNDHDSSNNNNNAEANNINNNNPTNKLLNVTEFLFGTNLLTSTVSIIDNGWNLITELIAPSGRTVHLIRGSKGDETYLCLTGSGQYYCSCRSFLEKSSKVSLMTVAGAGTIVNSTTKRQQQPQRNHPPICKHLLALKLVPYLAAADCVANQPNSNCNNTSDIFANVSYCPKAKVGTEEEFATVILNHLLLGQQRQPYQASTTVAGKKT
jgi:hypothetical protein